MIFDVSQRISEAWAFYDKLLDKRIDEISKVSGVSVEHMKKLNPAEFIERNNLQFAKNYEYKKISKWISENKTDANTFLISPLDAIEETAAQISYKSGTEIRRTIRASKCDVMPVPSHLALDFFIRNHRQTAPNIRSSSICFGLVYKDELVAVMLYDLSNGAIRGNKKDYELVRLSISKGAKIHGGASKLQAACEEALHKMGVSRIFSYSNATINSGAVYEKLGFDGSRVENGQPFVIMQNNELIRLISLHPNSTDEALALRGQLKTHLGGNRLWVKDI